MQSGWFSPFMRLAECLTDFAAPSSMQPTTYSYNVVVENKADFTPSRLHYRTYV